MAAAAETRARSRRWRKIDIFRFTKDANYREKILEGKPSIDEQRSAYKPNNKSIMKKFGDDRLVEQAIELQEQVQGETCSGSQREEIRKAPHEEL